jgi:hypothetical protein
VTWSDLVERRQQGGDVGRSDVVGVPPGGQLADDPERLVPAAPRLVGPAGVALDHAEVA